MIREPVPTPSSVPPAPVPSVPPVPPVPPVPSWLERVEPRLAAALAARRRSLPDPVAGVAAAADWFATFTPPAHPPRRSAVLMLFGPSTPPSTGLGDLLLTERAHTLRSHAAQVVCPGGHVEPGDDGPVAAALREAHEEAGLDPASVQVVAELPALYLHPAQMAVHPVLAWWPRPHRVRVVDTREVAQVLVADVGELLDPERRFTVVAPGHYRGPGFEVGGLVVWGFTAALIDALGELAGIAPAWDEHRTRALPGYLASAYWPD